MPEEEMVIWSLASLKGPLIECAYKRYMDLFTRTFGMGILMHCYEHFNVFEILPLLYFPLRMAPHK